MMWNYYLKYVDAQGEEHIHRENNFEQIKHLFQQLNSTEMISAFVYDPEGRRINGSDFKKIYMDPA